MITTRVVVFDVNETLSDTTPLEAVFASLGAGAATLPRWFAAVLRDGFALAAAGGFASFERVAACGLRTVLSPVALSVPLDEAVGQVMEALASLPVHRDVPGSVRTLYDRGFRLMTLSNGSTSAGERLLSAAGLRSAFDGVLSVDEVGAWKPHPAAYHHAAERSGCETGDMAMVAVHPWDIDGAARYGLRTIWVNREGLPYPAVFFEPDVVVASVSDLAGVIALA
ncbi:MAG TPA: haloacid dehalogenase type II [Acidimicrobiales bacterium]|nr:haloacid dehalogenase type II [Acidimicrobiales bacterium]